MSFRTDPEAKEKIRRIREFWLCRDACEKIQDVEAYELVGDVEFLLELVDKLNKQVEADDRYHRSINEALNMGDGVYRP